MVVVTYQVRESGGKQHLIIDARTLGSGGSVEDYPETMAAVVSALMEVNADIVIVSDIYDYVYDGPSVEILKDIARVARELRRSGFWSLAIVEKVGEKCERFLKGEGEFIVQVTQKLWMGDPVKAYVSLIRKIKLFEEREKAAPDNVKECFTKYLRILNTARKMMESSKVVMKFKDMLLTMKKPPKGREIYRALIKGQIKPAFLHSRLITDIREDLELVDTYMVNDVEVMIFRDPSDVQYLYYVNAPEYTLPPDQFFLLERTKQVVADFAPKNVLLTSRSLARKQLEETYMNTLLDVARQMNVKISREEAEQLVAILSRHTVGYGILEILFNDRRLTDIYLDAPLGFRPVYVLHSEYGQCRTNIVYTEEEAKTLVSKLRSMSGRPFDESHPVLDYDLPDLSVRVALIGPPLSPDGIAFAFRLHRTKPWTLPLFLKFRMFNTLAAGLLSFLIDSQSTVLVAGSRGAGKTSMMSSLILEIPLNQRIIVQEDTLEIPVEEMKRIGMNIQRLKTKSPIGGGSAGEVPPEDALRTALRLGDSAIVVGEVRSKEAKVLYEAMRVGAAGNVVMGTIHGDSPYSVWDRVVNDLGVPTTSFKATDIVIVNAPIRFAGSLRRYRRTVSITEVKKHWKEDPYDEGGFADLMRYDAGKDSLVLIEENLKNSEFLEKVMQLRGMKFEDIWKEIVARGKQKEMVLRLSQEYSVPELLEAEYTLPVHTKFLLLKERHLEEYGGVEWEELLTDLEEWVKETLVRGILASRGDIS